MLTMHISEFLDMVEGREMDEWKEQAKVDIFKRCELLKEENAALKKRVAELESYVGSEMAMSDHRTASELRQRAEQAESRLKRLRDAVEAHWAKMVDSELYKVLDEVTQSTRYTPGHDR